MRLIFAFMVMFTFTFTFAFMFVFTFMFMLGSSIIRLQDIWALDIIESVDSISRDGPDTP